MGCCFCCYIPNTKLEEQKSEDIRPVPEARKVNCPWKRCQQVLKSLRIPEPYFDHKGDKCYCKECYNESPIFSRGGEIYVMPIEGCRFGLKIQDSTIEKKWQKWQNAYHGTKLEAIKNIVTFGFAKAGDIIPYGEIKIPNNHLPEKYEFYSSPSFEYAKHNLYALTFNFGDGKYKAIFQLRHEPGSYKVQSETLGGEVKDDFVPQSKMEWVSQDTQQMALIGLIIYEEVPVKILPEMPELVPIEKKLKEEIQTLSMELKSLKDDLIPMCLILQQLIKLTDTNKNIKFTRVVGNSSCCAARIFGGILCFTPFFAAGLIIMGVSTVGSITCSVVTDSKEKTNADEIHKIFTGDINEKYNSLMQRAIEKREKIIILSNKLGSNLQLIEKKTEELQMSMDMTCYKLPIGSAGIAGIRSLLLSLKNLFKSSLEMAKTSSLASNGLVAFFGIEMTYKCAGELIGTLKDCAKILGVLSIALDCYLLCSEIYKYSEETGAEYQKFINTIKNRHKSLTVVITEMDKFISLAENYKN